MNCVYIIRHPPTGVFYIGSTSNRIRRKWEHMSKLRRGVHDNELLMYAYNFDRELSWEYIEASSREEAHALEQAMIKEHYGLPLLANRVGAQVRTEEMRKTYALNRKGKVFSVEQKKALSDMRKGVPKNPEWIDKITNSRRIKVSIDGTVYRSVKEAAVANDLHSQTVLNRIKDSRFPEWFKLPSE